MRPRLVTAALAAGLVLALPAVGPSADGSVSRPHSLPAPTSPRVFAALQYARGGANLVVDDLAASGLPTPAVGSPHGTSGPEADAVAVSPLGFVFVSAHYSGEISAYRVGAGGDLTEVPGSPYQEGFSPNGLAVSADGTRLVATNYDEATVSVFVVAANGTLTEVIGSPFPAPGLPLGLALSADGGHLYVGGYHGSIWAYSVDAAGVPDPIEAFDAPGSVTDPVLTPDGRHLYATGFNTNVVYAFDVASDGTFSALPDSPYPTSGLPLALAVSPDGANLYVSSIAGTDIGTYAIATDGSLTGVDTISDGVSFQGLAVAPGGRFVFALNRDRLYGFARSSTGTLTELSGSPFSFGTGGFAPLRSLAISPDLSPRAAFTSVSTSDTAVTLDATGSSDPDGSIARYDWDFGDGTTLVDGGATPHHVYAEPGVHRVTLTTTDDLGCSTQVVTTGQTPSCALTAGARVTSSVGATPATGPSDGPTLTARTKTRTSLDVHGHPHTRTTVRFACTDTGVPLTTACPAAVVVRRHGHDRTIRRSVTDASGRTTTVAVLVRPAGAAPYLRLRGVHDGHTYDRSRTPRCTATDLSGARLPCRVHVHTERRGDGITTVTYRIKATDAAHDVTVRTGRFYER